MTTSYARRPPGARAVPTPNPEPAHAFGAGLYPEPDPGPQGPGDRAPAAKPTLLRVKVYGSLQGARCEIEAEVEPRLLRKLVPRLEAHGFVPSAPPLQFDLTADGAPICPRHRVAMRMRQKQGDTWHNHQVTLPDGKEVYCRGYPGPESPGYES